ncbi:hypothetical protein E2P81_ATG02800 [Venturia nashicola]|uniref:Uncharacterized protein n=1 Tax=Venturia nashicola TaxID=86259 RepID=A0A4Z1P896_9PEZI|nr:hypothetical protein E6O75_ATG02860 [Venturia nashicola]TLD37018.1 hypothetical protein E2P81_ATG02800 [Venturia nashicola]
MPPKHGNRPGADRVGASKLPQPLQYILVVILSFTASLALYSACAIFTKFELSTVSRRVNDPLEALIFPAWRIIELAVGWFARYDDLDMAALTVQTRLPYYFLINTFYQISLSTSIICLAIDVASASLPFLLMRSRIPAHCTKSPAGSVAYRTVLKDFTTNAYVTIFGASIYSVVLFASIQTWLTVYLVTNFDGVRSFESARAMQIPAMIISCLPLGWSATTFLFSPSIAAKPGLSEIRGKAFNPEQATLWDHFKHNTWGWSAGTKVIVKRNLVLSALVGIATWLRVWKTLEGSEMVGSAGWAALWAGTNLVTGVLMRWVAAA